MATPFPAFASNEDSSRQVNFACSSLSSYESLAYKSPDSALVDYTTLTEREILSRVYEDPLSMVEMARREGTRRSPDVDLIYGYLHRAQELQSNTAALALSKVYQGVSGFPKDEKASFYWLKRSAELGSIVACQQAGLAYSKKGNHYDAVRYLGNLEALGASHSEESLEALALSTSALEPSGTHARELLMKSAENGGTGALLALASLSQKQVLTDIENERLIGLYATKLQTAGNLTAEIAGPLLSVLTTARNFEKYAEHSYGLCINVLGPSYGTCSFLMGDYRNQLTLEQMQAIQALSASQTIELLK